MTLTLDKFTARHKTTPTPFTARHKESDPCGQPIPTPSDYDYFVGPFPSWLNVKDPPAAAMASTVGSQWGDWVPAVGDGVADDTLAIQWALDFSGQVKNQPLPLNDGPSGINPATDPGWRSFIPGQVKSASSTGYASGSYPPVAYGVVYLPAGNYRITKQLKIFNRNYLSLIGEDPATTKITWDGPAWTPVAYASQTNFYPDNLKGYDLFFSDAGTGFSGIRRITFDGANKARSVLLISSGQHLGYDGNPLTPTITPGGSSQADLLDCRIINGAYGILAGGTSGAQDDTTSVKRCYFGNITRWAMTTTTYNTLFWSFWYCTFEYCGVGLYTWSTGLVSSKNCLYLNCGQDIYLGLSATTEVRGNVSITTTDYDFNLVYNPAFPYKNNLYVSTGGVMPVPFQVTGNLVVNAGVNLAGVASSVSFIVGVRGPGALIDNAFYDNYPQSLGTLFPIRTNQPYVQYNHRPANPVTGAFPQQIWTAWFYSGNVYNGVPTGPDASQTNNPKLLVDNSLPSGYTPPNSLNITQAEVATLLQSSYSDPLIAEIKSRMPGTAPRIDPTDTAQVRFTEINPTSGPVAASINDAITNADPTLLNLIHIGAGISVPSYANIGAFAIPGNIRFHVIGDGLATRVAYNSGSPLFLAGDNSGSPVKFRLEDISIVDNLPLASSPATANGVVHVQSGDMIGGRCYSDYAYSIANDNVQAKAAMVISGFNNLKARFDDVHSSSLQCIGTGGTVTSADDVTLNVYGMFLGVKNPGLSPCYVSNGGSAIYHGMYGESQGSLIDLRNGSGYIVVENTVKQQATGTGGSLIPTAAQATNYFSNFTGTAMFLVGDTVYSIWQLDPPASGSQTAVFGVFGRTFYATSPNNAGYPPYQQAISMSMPGGFVATADVSFAGLLGLTSTVAQNAPSNLIVGGNACTYNFNPSDPIAGGVAGTLNAAIDAMQLTMSVTGLIPTGGSGTFLKIDNEQMTVGSYSGGNITLSARGANSTTPATHDAGAQVTFATWPGPGYSQNGFFLYTIIGGLPLLPEGVAATNFALPSEVINAMRYRPFPHPGAITDPSLSDIVFHKTSIVTYRQYCLMVVKTP